MKKRAVVFVVAGMVIATVVLVVVLALAVSSDPLDPTMTFWQCLGSSWLWCIAGTFGIPIGGMLGVAWHVNK